MKVAAGLLRQWSSENPARLPQAALWQAERLSEMAPQLEALRAKNASLEQQLEAQTKRLAELEKALEAAQRAAHRQAAPFRVEPQNAPWRPNGPDASVDIRALSGISLSKSMRILRSNSVRAHTVVASSSGISRRANSSSKSFPGAPSGDTAEDLRGYLSAMRAACPFRPSPANVTGHWRRRYPTRTPSSGPGR